MSHDADLIHLLATESIDHIASDERRQDPFGDLLPFALATFVDGTAITPRGFDETDQFSAGDLA